MNDSTSNGKGAIKEPEDVKPPVGLDRNLEKRPRSSSQTHPHYVKASTNSTQSTWKDHLTEIAKINYCGLTIKIFAETNYGKSDSQRRFYFEPAVLLDPQSFASESHGLLKQDYVRFTIRMWNEELQSKVKSCLKSILTGVKMENISVMPYEDVQLSFKKGFAFQPFRLLEERETASYERQNESLDFYFLCDSLSTATTLAKDFRLHPNFSLKNFPLQLVCKGLVLRNTAELSASMDRPSFTFNVSNLPAEKEPVSTSTPRPTKDAIAGECKDLETRILALRKKKLASHVVPVFGASKCINPDAFKGQSLGFSALEFETVKEHGSFQLETGIFTVKTPGFYQFNFSGHISTLKSNRTHCITLQVDGIVKAVSDSRTSAQEPEYLPVNLSALVPLKIGEKVGVYMTEGKLFQRWADGHVARFSGILLG